MTQIPSQTYRHQDTEFQDNAIAIDPTGCGCTDCIIGDSIPLDSPSSDALLDIVLRNRPFINRTSVTVAIIELSDGWRALPGVLFTREQVNQIMYSPKHGDTKPFYFLVPASGAVQRLLPE